MQGSKPKFRNEKWNYGEFLQVSLQEEKEEEFEILKFRAKFGWRILKAFLCLQEQGITSKNVML